jgi:hypothetical protein
MNNYKVYFRESGHLETRYIRAKDQEEDLVARLKAIFPKAAIVNTYQFKEPVDPDACTCDDCQDREYPCHGDCDEDSLCQGCREYREGLEEKEFEIDSLEGRY